jgi:hypothetical protein
MSSPFEPPDDGGARPLGKLPYERQRRDPAQAPVEPPTYEPAKWKAVRTGLAIIFWAWAAILALGALFLAFWLGNSFLHKLETPVMRSVGGAAACAGLACLAAIFVGHCLCMFVPAMARARAWAIASVCAAVATLALVVVMIFEWPPQFGTPPPDQKPAAEAAAPQAEAPKVVEAPKAEGEAPKAEGQPADAVPTTTESLVPRIRLQRLPKLAIVAAYFLSQLFFMFFIRKIALFLHEIPLAESIGGYTTLLLAHSLLLGLLPTEAMIACFFWLIMVALEFVIIAWLLILLAGVRRALV